MERAEGEAITDQALRRLAASFRLAAFFMRQAERPGAPDPASLPVCLAVEGIARASAGRVGRELATVLKVEPSAPEEP